MNRLRTLGLMTAVATAGCGSGTTPTPLVVYVTPVPTVAAASPTPSQTANTFGPELAATIGEFGFTWGLVCTDFGSPGGDPLSATAVRRALKNSEVAAPSFTKILALDAPKGWLAITNDAKAITERAMKALITVSSCLAVYETESPAALGACYQEAIDASCGTLSEDVNSVREAIDAMP